MNEKDMKNIIEAVMRDMTDVSSITLEIALSLAQAVREKASEIGVKAVVAIADRGANPVLVQCMDDSYIASYDIALNKAYTSVALKMPTWKLSELAKPGSSLYGIQHTNGGKIVIFGGGEPLCNRNGEIIGALGVSGGSESEDTALAAYGKEIFEKG
ncbi:MAG: heme-binding protein [Clostridia bacterium]|nr:heme-binding protein [Clostridia bacterium]